MACLSGFCASKREADEIKFKHSLYCWRRTMQFNDLYTILLTWMWLLKMAFFPTTKLCIYTQTCVLVLIEHPWRIWLFSLGLRLDVSHGDPLAGLTQSPCFPLKSHCAVVLLGAMQVNISISIESVLFWRSSVFLGSSALAQLSLGSSPVCAGPSTPLLHPCMRPTMENANKNWIHLLLLQPGVDMLFIRENKAKNKTTQRPCSLFCKTMFTSLHMPQVNKQAQTYRETCNKSGIVWEGHDRCL